MTNKSFTVARGVARSLLLTACLLPTRERDSDRTICPLVSSRRVVNGQIHLGSINVTAAAPMEVAGMSFFQS